MYNLKTFEEAVNSLTVDKVKVLSFNGVKKPVTFICLKCNKTQTVQRGEVLLRKNKKYQCKYCHNNKEQQTKDALSRVQKLCAKLDLTLLYMNKCSEQITLKCNKCGHIFHPIANTFLQRENKCPNCQPKGGQILSLFAFKEKLKERYGDDYQIVDESQYINSHTPILIRHCCGFIWSIKPTKLLYANECPHCSRSISKGERKIMKLLKEHDVNYIWQKKEKINNKTLYFDFYLPNTNMYIEYQGEQHFHPVDYFGGDEHFLKQQENDNIKKEWCEKNQYTLLSISYIDFKSIEEILKAQRLF